MRVKLDSLGVGLDGHSNLLLLPLTVAHLFVREEGQFVRVFERALVFFHLRRLHLLQHDCRRVKRNALLKHLLTREQVAEVHIGDTALEVQDCIGMPMVSQPFLNHLFDLLVLASIDEFLSLLLQALDIRIEAALQARFDAGSLCSRGWSRLALHNIDLFVAILD